MLYKNDGERQTEIQLITKILQYSMPEEKARTKAKRLIETFGCMNNVMMAEFADLQNDAQLSETEAFVFVLFKKLMMYTEYEKFGDTPNLSDIQTRKRFVQAMISMMPYEDFYLFLLDKNNKMIKAIPVSHGKEGMLSVSVRVVTDIAIKSCAKGVIAVHTHPVGSSKPSYEDIKSTTHFETLLKKLDIRLVDHIIVGKTDVYSMAEFNIL